MLMCARQRSGFRLAVHQQVRNRVELIAEVEAHRPDRRVVAQARPDVDAQAVALEPPGPPPTLPASTNPTRLSLLPIGTRTSLEASSSVRPPIGWPVLGERAHLVAPPAAQAGRAAEEVALEERHRRIGRRRRVDGRGANALREDDARGASRRVPADGRRVESSRALHRSLRYR